MRSKKMNLKKYKSDKVDYLAIYDDFFSLKADKKILLLELGVYRGESLLMWRDYFEQGKIVGVDLDVPSNFRNKDRIKVYQGNQIDKEFLTRVAQDNAPQGFDIIIDDASHIGAYTKISFWHLFLNHLKPGGIFVIEDWGTGYWSDWPDGAQTNDNSESLENSTITKNCWHSHSFGMVGFIKQLIDELGVADATKNSEIKMKSKISKMTIFPGIVFVEKQNN